MKVSLMQVLASLTEEEAQAAYHALAQWSDNERNGLDEEGLITEDDRRDHEKRSKEVLLVEKIVDRLDEEFCKLAEVA